MNILFETDQLLVRNLTHEDALDFFRLNSNEMVMRFIAKPKNREESDDYLQENLKLYLPGSIIGRYAIIEKASNAFVGLFSLLYFSPKDAFHMGYALLPLFWGKGLAAELVKAGLCYFFASTQQTELFAITQPANKASIHLLLKSGFQSIGLVKENGEIVELFQIIKK